MARSHHRDTRSVRDFRSRPFIPDVLKIVGRIKGMGLSSLDGGVIARSLYGHLRFYRPPSFTTFASCRKGKQVEIDKIATGEHYLLSRVRGKVKTQPRNKIASVLLHAAKTRHRALCFGWYAREYAVTMTSVTRRLCTRKRRWLFRFGSNYDRGGENSRASCLPCARYRQADFWANSDGFWSLWGR